MNTSHAGSIQWLGTGGEWKRSVLLLFLFLAAWPTCRADGAASNVPGSVADDLRREFVIKDVTDVSSASVLLRGIRKQDLKAGRSEERIYRVDVRTLAAKPVLDEIVASLREKWGRVGHMRADLSHGLVSFCPRKTKANGVSDDILVYDIDTGTTLAHVSDGRRNLPPVFSPDARRIAYSSYDPETAMRPDVEYMQGAGYVVEIASGQRTQVTPAFPMKGQYPTFVMPVWLDADRVLFSTFCTNPDVIRAQIPGNSKSDMSKAVAVANVESGEVRWLVLPTIPGQHLTPPEVRLDPVNRRVLITDQRSIVLSTDYDLGDRAVVYEADSPNTRVVLRGVDSLGEPNYSVEIMAD